MNTIFFKNFISNVSIYQELEFFLRIVIASFCGAFIGFERTKRFKEAGIRTHILVACASALMMVVSKYGFADLQYGAEFLAGTKVGDPSRIASQVICGISFLGAGVIFKHGASVKGLTTAAGIWATSGIGLAIGAGMYFEGIFVTMIVILSQLVMHKVTLGKDLYETAHINVTVNNAELFKSEFEAMMEEMGATITYILISKNANDTTSFRLTALLPRKKNMSELVIEASKNENIITFSATPTP